MNFLFHRWAARFQFEGSIAVRGLYVWCGVFSLCPFGYSHSAQYGDMQVSLIGGPKL